MANQKTNVIIVSLLVLIAIIVSACTQPYSSVPLETPDVDPTSLFVEPVPTNAMEIIENFATGTAMAAETEAAQTAGPGASGSEVTPDSATNTPGSAAEPTSTSTLGSVAPSATQPAPTVITNSPGSYTLQNGEFPFCIARRFNVDPAELLSLNGLTSGDIYYPNLTLSIPQSGRPFPGTRSLRSHPTTYTVTDANESVYGIACAFGDVDPAAIVRANSGISLSSTLTVGQQISIP